MNFTEKRKRNNKKLLINNLPIKETKNKHK